MIESELINKLKRMNKGANVHTINKTVFYLQNDKYDNKIYLSELAEKSYLTGDWSMPKKLLRFQF